MSVFFFIYGKKKYSGQTGEIITDKVSKKFGIQRGTKQGDPLSPKIFNVVLEKLIRDIQPKWRSKGMGLRLGEREEDQQCNLRFADDLLLISTKKTYLEAMLKDLEKVSKQVGLQIHTGKTKVLTNTGQARGADSY